MNNTLENNCALLSERETERLMAREVAQVLGHHADENLHWRGTVTDLMEVLHRAFTTCLLTDADGLILSFTAIVTRACEVLHVRRPSNPYETASRACRRKGLQRVTYLQRYQRRLRTTPYPLHEQIDGCESNLTGQTHIACPTSQM